MSFFFNNSSNFNFPNTLSSIRLGMAFAVCALIELGWYWLSMILFIVATSTDFIDGWWARKYQQITKLGRILDPLVDKVIIAGTLIALVGIPTSGLAPWMATLVVFRELLVTSLRGLVESSGGDFSAKQLGKWKFLFQCAAVVAILLCLAMKAPPAWLLWTRFGLIWVAIAITFLSGYEYVMLVVRSSKK
jgi:CDP-diacylglycerol---glycerol-3-phosphate 3-phosphatidyltransferase